MLQQQTIEIETVYLIDTLEFIRLKYISTNIPITSNELELLFQKIILKVAGNKPYTIFYEHPNDVYQKILVRGLSLS